MPPRSGPDRLGTRPADGPPPRVVVQQLHPGTGTCKRVVGEPLDVVAAVFADGHDAVFAALQVRGPTDRVWTRIDLVSSNPGLDEWSGRFVPRRTGDHRFRLLGWVDRVASWQDGTRRKLDAGQAVDAELLVGAHVLEDLAAASPVRLARRLRSAAERLQAGRSEDVWSEALVRAGRAALRPAAAVIGEPAVVQVERERALFSTWYELFPRSWSTDPATRPHGTLADVTAQLDEIAELGADVLYLPPIHPIGTKHRKGADNAPTATGDDPGSPWAIGSAEGGHTAVHPRLGTLDDLRDLVGAASERDIEVALDLAWQCSPDHPWVTEHPAWFAHRPDGSIQYAENPPKRYQDIYPLDFESADWASLWEALAEVVRFWIAHGITVFRVDNPHTKPFAFWQWLLAEIRATHPDTIFLAEAFTRPRVMAHLADIGFTQSYTYFTWRVTKAELTAYARELATPPSVDAFRPNLWPTTPDILPWHLQDAPREANALRLVLAATLSPSYGIYGPSFELADNRPAGNGKEEHLHSEKYEIRTWDRTDAASLRPLIARLNHIRRDQLALRTLRTLAFHGADNDQILVYAKHPHEGATTDPEAPAHNPVLCVVNLDPVHAQASVVRLDLASLGLDAGRPFVVDDLLGGRRFEWFGPDNYVELRPSMTPAHLFRVSQP